MICPKCGGDLVHRFGVWLGLDFENWLCTDSRCGYQTEPE